MPSTYAHYYFGNLVLEKLTASQKLVVEKHHDLYNIGLHGPDILFYYHPLKSNPISKSGYEMHEKKAKDFFGKAREIASQNQTNDLAYLFGFICHFALDAKCHPYVEKYSRDNQVSHTNIEVAFDKYLLEKMGYKASKYHLSQHIRPSHEASKIISPYFDKTTPHDIDVALKSMNFFHHLLHSSNSVKRKILYTGMDIVRQAGFKDQIMPKNMHSQCLKSNQDLNELLEAAINDACLLINEFEKNLYTKQPLNDLYEHTFGEF